MRKYNLKYWFVLIYLITLLWWLIMDMKHIQKQIWQNKINKGFNTTDVNKEFCLLYGEVSESYEAYRKKKNEFIKNIDGVNIRISG